MPSYLIVNYKVENPELYAEYSAGAGPAMKVGEACKLVAFDTASEALEGSPGHPGSSPCGRNPEQTRGARHWSERTPR